MTWPSSNLYRRLIASARAAAEPFHASSSEHGALLERLGSPYVTLIGEASHGTQDFYHLRASITKYQIEHRGLDAIAVEADWPDAYRVNRFVRGEGVDGDANSALSGFERFPSWMWRNTEVLSFVRWLREWNDRHPKRKVGFYGLDLYSLSTSIQAVITYLDKVDSEAAGGGRAQNRPSGARRIDRGLAARCRHPAGLAAPRRSAAGRLRHTVARTRDWGNLSTADRASEPLFPDPRHRAVRRADSRRSVDRARATRALLPLVARSSSRDLSRRSLGGGHV